MGLVSEDKVPDLVRRYLDGKESAAVDEEVGLCGGGLLSTESTHQAPVGNARVQILEDEALKATEELRAAERTIKDQSVYLATAEASTSPSDERIESLLGRLRDQEAVNQSLMRSAAERRQIEEARVLKRMVDEA